MKPPFARIAAPAVVDAGAEVVTHVPGFGCARISGAICKIGLQALAGEGAFLTMLPSKRQLSP